MREEPKNQIRQYVTTTNFLAKKGSSQITQEELLGVAGNAVNRGCEVGGRPFKKKMYDRSRRKRSDDAVRNN